MSVNKKLSNKYPWLILLLVYLSAVAASMNQFKVPPLMPLLMEEFQLNFEFAGLLMSIFGLTGLILALPTGFIIEKSGPKLIGLLGLTCLVLGSIFGAYADASSSLLLSRFVEGLGLGLITIVGLTLIAMWFPPSKQGVPMGIWSTWSPCGSLLMYNFAPSIALTSNWHTVWFISAGFALLVGVFYAIFIKMPTVVTDHAEKQDTASQKNAVTEIFLNKNVWLLSAAFACFIFVFAAYASFLPTFLSTEKGYSLIDASFTASIPTFSILIGAPFFGWLSDNMGSRKLFFILPFVLISLMFWLSFELVGGQLVVFLIILGCLASAIPTALFSSIPQVIGKGLSAGLAMAILMAGQYLGMTAGPAIFGMFVESLGWVTAGYMLIPVCFIGVISGCFVKVK